MKPNLFEMGGIVVDSYSFFYILAWIVGVSVFFWEAHRREWAMGKMLLLVGSCAIGAALGASALEVLFLEPVSLTPKIGFLDFTGKTVLGGIAGGFLAIEFTKKRLGITTRTGDAFAMAIPIGHSIGRLGCLFGGCCYGTPTHLPWGLSYPEGSLPFYMYDLAGLLPGGATQTMALHPAPIYEIVANMLILIVLLRFSKIFIKPGSLFRLYLVLYAGFRFLIEFLRADTEMFAAIQIKPVQIFLLVVVGYFAHQLYQDEIKHQGGVS